MPTDRVPSGQDIAEARRQAERACRTNGRQDATLQCRQAGDLAWRGVRASAKRNFAIKESQSAGSEIAMCLDALDGTDAAKERNYRFLPDYLAWRGRLHGDPYYGGFPMAPVDMAAEIDRAADWIRRLDDTVPKWKGAKGACRRIIADVRQTGGGWLASDDRPWSERRRGRGRRR